MAISGSSDLGLRLRTFVIQIVSVLIDTLFLSVWLLLQWSLKNLSEKFQLDGIHGHMLSVYQVTFGLATLFPITAYIAVDLWTIYVRSKKAIAGLENKS